MPISVGDQVTFMIKGFPIKQDIIYDRELALEFSIIGQNYDETPFDFSGGELSMDLKVNNYITEPLFSISNDYFTLSQTAEAIQYDVDKSFPSGTTRDIINVDYPANLGLDDMVYPNVNYDIQWLGVNDVHSLLFGKLFANLDCYMGLNG